LDALCGTAALSENKMPTVLPPILINFKKIDDGSLFHRQMLELAEPVKFLSRAGIQVISEWCADADNRKDSQRFCSSGVYFSTFIFSFVSPILRATGVTR
jgi:hypothetical protein